jgi:hypothetical protein
MAKMMMSLFVSRQEVKEMFKIYDIPVVPEYIEEDIQEELRIYVHEGSDPEADAQQRNRVINYFPTPRDT